MGMMIPLHSYSKGPIFCYLDKMSKRTDARELLSKLSRALSDKASSGYPDLDVTFDQYLFSPLGVGHRIAKISAYLKTYWLDLDSEELFLPHLQPVAPIFAEGILKTIALSLRRDGQPLPIDSWWLMDYVDFRMLNFVSEQQVTLLMATPRPIGKVPQGIWDECAEAYTTGRLGIVTRKFESD